MVAVGHSGNTWTYPVLAGAAGRPIVVDVHDGDTLRLLLDAGCETGLFPWLRVAGCDAPELRDAGGPEARDYLAALVGSAVAVEVTVHGRSFDRWVARVDVDGQDLAGLMIAAGHARPYPG